MSDDHNRLTDEQKTTVKAWLEDHWEDDRANCPVCAERPTTWVIGTHLMSGTLLGTDGEVMLARGYPFVVVFCQNCAYTMFFNAMPMDIMKLDQEEPSDGE